MVGTDVKIAWTAPYSGGSGVAITSYSILIRKHDSTFVSYLPACDGTDATVISNRYCLIPMSDIISTFGLLQGELIVAKVKATNSKGDSPYSTINTVGELA
jgi:hypothetical protein